jgi:hypothetical protein
MEFLIFLAIMAAVIVFVSRPLWRVSEGPSRDNASPARATHIADLEAAREAKYREIRDAELDHRTGKLSQEDFQAVDRALRTEALEILQELERTGAEGATVERAAPSD